MRTVENEKYRIEFTQSEFCDSPREWDVNMTKMVCFHRRFKLGDEHNYNHNDYDGWDEMEAAIKRKEDVLVIKPLYMYDHSGQTISTTPFSCQWDSGQIGFVFVTKESIRECFGIKRVSNKYIEKAEAMIDCEVKTYDQYITGDVYGFDVTDKENDVVIDSSTSYYGNCFWKNGMADSIQQDVIDSLQKELEAEFGKKDEK
jgi:hypothetical protein